MHHKATEVGDWRDGKEYGLHRLKLVATPLEDKHKSNFRTHEQESDGSELVATQDSRHPRAKNPIFKQRHEASSVELFFDLFFVANLTIVGLNHEGTSAKCK